MLVIHLYTMPCPAGQYFAQATQFGGAQPEVSNNLVHVEHVQGCLDSVGVTWTPANSFAHLLYLQCGINHAHDMSFTAHSCNNLATLNALQSCKSVEDKFS